MLLKPKSFTPLIRRIDKGTTLTRVTNRAQTPLIRPALQSENWRRDLYEASCCRCGLVWPVHP